MGSGLFISTACSNTSTNGWMSRINDMDMTTAGKIDQVLDAFNLGVVTPTELRWILPLVLKRGETLDERTLVLYMTGIDIDHVEDES